MFGDSYFMEGARKGIARRGFHGHDIRRGMIPQEQVIFDFVNQVENVTLKSFNQIDQVIDEDE